MSTLSIKRISAVCLILSLLPLPCSGSPEAAKDTPVEQIALADSQAGLPKVEIPETLFDFGDLKEDEDYVHAFTIWNLGTGVLEIKKVLPG
jgi:hypothetical protein